MFRHVHDLSLRFHLGRRTGALARILDNGMRAIASLLFDAIFVVLPLIAEVGTICVVLLGMFEPVFAIIVVVTLSLYLTFLAIGSEWLRKHQRRAVAMGAEAQGKAVDSMLNYETVKFFGNEDHIAARYDGTLREVERLTVLALSWRSLLGLAQVSILALGISGMVLIAGGKVAAGGMTVGGFVLVNTYMLQLLRPLERVGALYRSIKRSLTELEMMLGLLDEKAEVLDAPDAIELPSGPGTVAFEGISFAYDPRRPILEDVSFRVEPGATVALVGPSGAGKSTIGRFLFRFYDVTKGRVVIDGYDARALT